MTGLEEEEEVDTEGRNDRSASPHLSIPHHIHDRSWSTTRIRGTSFEKIATFSFTSGKDPCRCLCASWW